MAGFVAGQRYISEPEPELGLGTVVSVGSFQVGIRFLASGEERLYASDTFVLKRARFRVGEKVSNREGESFKVDQVEEREGLLYYSGEDLSFCEDVLSDSTSFSSPHDRLLGGTVGSRRGIRFALQNLEDSKRTETIPNEGLHRWTSSI